MPEYHDSILNLRLMLKGITSRLRLFLTVGIAGLSLHGSVHGAMIIAGKGRGFQPHVGIKGKPMGVTSDYTFSLTVGATNTRLDLVGTSPFLTGTNIVRTFQIFYAPGEYFTVYPELSGQQKSGTTIREWDGTASISTKFRWPDLTPQTLLLAFDSERKLYGNPGQVPIYQGPSIRPPDAPQFYPESLFRGEVPRAQSEILLLESEDNVRERWTFLASTNLLGTQWPTQFRREVFHDPVAKTRLPKVTTEMLEERWEFDIESVAYTEQEPVIPAINGMYRIFDDRLGGQVTYYSDHWRSLEEVGADDSLVPQLLAHGFGRPRAEAERRDASLAASTLRNQLAAFLARIVLVVAVLVGVGLLVWRGLAARGS